MREKFTKKDGSKTPISIDLSLPGSLFLPFGLMTGMLLATVPLIAATACQCISPEILREKVSESSKTES